MSDNFSIRYASEERDKSAVVAFVREIYESEFGTCPPVADVYSFIEDRSGIIAAMGINLLPANGRFSIETRYAIDRDTLALAVSDSNCVELCRWASKHPIAGMGAVYGAVHYAIMQAKSFGFVEHDKATHRHCIRRLGVAFFDIKHTPLDPSKLTDPADLCYKKKIMKPYQVDLNQMKLALAERIGMFISL